MAEIAGYGGNVTFVGGYVTNVKSWTMDYEVQVHDTTDFAGAGEANAVRGIRKWSGGYTCSLDSAIVVLAPGVVGAAVFTASAGKTFGGNIMLTAVHIGVNAQDLNEVTCDYVSQGTIVAIA